MIKWILESVIKGMWPPALIFFSSMTGTFYFDIDKVFLNQDVFFHILGGVTIAYFYSKSIVIGKDQYFLNIPDKFYFKTILFFLVCLSAIFWEITEFIVDPYLDHSLQLGRNDTILDLVFGLIGGLLYFFTPSFKRHKMALTKKSFLHLRETKNFN